jgi:hypothetical protein
VVRLSDLDPNVFQYADCQIAQDTGDSAPSYDVIYEVVRQLPAGLLTLAHEGKKAYSATFDLVHRREAERPNAIWQTDHTLLDILVQREGENPAQPWLTVILDDYSRAVAVLFPVSMRHLPRRWRWLCARRSGARMIRAGMFVGFPICSIWNMFRGTYSR